MRNTMVRTLAVAALGVGAMAFGSAAVAAPPASSRFAGKYTGPVPAIGAGDYGSITVSSGGGIAFQQPPAEGDGWRLSGSVSSDGAFTITGKYHAPGDGWIKDVLPAPVETSDPAERSPTGAAANPSIEFTWTFVSTGTIVLGGDGNLHGTTTAGNSFVWTRK